MRNNASALAALAAIIAAPAVAQRTDTEPVYSGAQRPDMPAANPRPYAPGSGGPQQVFAEFGAWSRAHGNPQILLFWNRELGDDTTTRHRDRTQGIVATAVGPGAKVTAYDQAQEQELTTGGKYTAIGRNRSLDLESPFIDAFLRSGANILDRNALMRKVSTRHAQQDRSDQQFIEAMALEQGVDYLVEILPDYDASPGGLLFTVKITHLPSSRVRAQFRTNATPLAGPAQLVARPGGYSRETENRNRPEYIADALAADTMRRFF